MSLAEGFWSIQNSDPSSHKSTWPIPTSRDVYRLAGKIHWINHSKRYVSWDFTEKVSAKMRQRGMSKRYYEISMHSEIRTKLAVFANLEGGCFPRIRKNMQIASSYVTPITPGVPSHGEIALEVLFNWWPEGILKHQRKSNDAPWLFLFYFLSKIQMSSFFW